MFGPWIEVFVFLKGLMPTLPNKNTKFRWPKFNFITIHYLYMLAMTIVVSIIFFCGGNMAYIDALLFASGVATQSGLNPIDVNKLATYQQAVMMIFCCMSTPIFINSFVVFVRLYWFEKRFQNVVLEAQKFRRTRERTRTKSQAKEDIDMEEKGVGGRKIIVMRPGNKTIDKCAEGLHGDHCDHEHEAEEERDNTSDEDEEQPESSGQGRSSSESNFRRAAPRRDIAFADEVRTDDADSKSQNEAQKDTAYRDLDDEVEKEESNSADDRLPTQRSADQHISFVENQRNPKDKTVLYIPGPRDFDRGQVPQQYEVESPADLTRKRTNDTPISPFNPGDVGRRFRWDKVHIRRPLGRKISFDKPFSKAKESVLSKIHDEDEKNEEKPGGESTPHPIGQRGRTRTFTSVMSGRSGRSAGEENDPMPYLSYQPTLGRNSAFVNLSEEQREELGGVEYRALKTLAIILLSFYVGFHLLGMICLLPWITQTSYASIPEAVGQDASWWGVFTPASLFNDLGYTLTPDSMISFATAIFPLLLGSFLIIIGNTGFPCALRFMIWIMSKLTPKNTSLWEELRFLLDHPRRCFTLLFPSKATWWLFWILVLLNGVDLIFYIVLDLNDPVVTSVSPGLRVLDGWFQAASTRTAGFAVVDLAELHPAIQVSYLVMMYISVLPIAISVRRTNVYEEKSLGIWGEEEPGADPDKQSYVSSHLRRQLSFDLWFVFLGLFIIAIVEGDRLANTKQVAFTTFSVLFEIISAYGTVGLSLGYPGTNTSFCAQFRTISKLVIIAMEIRGRHRGLPYALDKAILLPSEGLQRKENEDATYRAMRRNSLNIQDQTRTITHGRSQMPLETATQLAEADEPAAPRDKHSKSTQYTNANALDRQETAHQSERSATVSSQSRQQRGGLTRLISSALSAGPSAPTRRRNP